MQRLKKYAAVAVLILVFPIARFIASSFMLEPSNEIYAYIPQESDFIVELNTQNFIKEMAYQRIYKEAYFMDRVYPETDEEPEKKFVDTGIDLFGKVILFREEWVNETIWFAILKYTDEDLVRTFLTEQAADVHFEFGTDYLIAQLTPSSNQEKVDEHLKKVSKKEVKAFTERVNLANLFDPQKEINCYVIPRNTPSNQIIEGYFSFDFLTDHIAIEGALTPVPNFDEIPPAAYALDTEKALSLRSSLNLLNSIYWFNKEKIDNLPQYKQMALDYDGVDCKLVHKKLGFSTPFRSYPAVEAHFDITNKAVWYNFFDSLRVGNAVQIDTSLKTLITAEGAHFHYDLSPTQFELMQKPFTLSPATENNIYFDFRMDISDMIDRTVFSVDEQHPPSDLEQSLGLMIANKIMDEIRFLANIESISFRLTKESSTEILANGRLEMNEKNGHSMVESLSFGSAAARLMRNY